MPLVILCVYYCWKAWGFAVHDFANYYFGAYAIANHFFNPETYDALAFNLQLKKEGFEPNPYDPCVWNRQVDGSQQTTCFHVDDCKLSHKDPKVNQAFVETFRKEYESTFVNGSGKMKAHTGKIHEFHGMTLDYSEEGIVKV